MCVVFLLLASSNAGPCIVNELGARHDEGEPWGGPPNDCLPSKLEHTCSVFFFFILSGRRNCWVPYGLSPPISVSLPKFEIRHHPTTLLFRKKRTALAAALCLFPHLYLITHTGPDDVALGEIVTRGNRLFCPDKKKIPSDSSFRVALFVLTKDHPTEGKRKGTAPKLDRPSEEDSGVDKRIYEQERMFSSLFGLL